MKSDGASEGEHRSSAAAQWAMLGKPVARVSDDPDPECPPELDYLWEDFIEIVAGLPQGGFGPAVVTWESLNAWSQLTDTELEPWEARTLIRLGARRAAVMGEEGGGNAKADH